MIPDMSRQRPSPHDRYRTDPAFRNLVDMLYLQIHEAKYTPTEVREAAMLAQILYEERVLRPIIMDDIREDG
jgi:hypothetical protein